VRPRDAARLLFLVNPRAGGRLGRAVAAFVLESLERRGLVLDRDFRIEFTRPGEVVRQAAEAAGRAPVVVAVGGDGTILETIRGLVASGRDATLGVIPLGTGNDFSRTLGLYRPIGPRSRRAVDRICEVILRGNRTPVDLLEINGRLLFASYFSFGVDAKVACAFAGLRPRLSGALLGSTLANKAVLFCLGLRYLGDAAPDGVRLRVAGPDGRLEEVPLPRRFKTLIVSNIRHYGGGARVSPTAELADGRFEVTVVPTARDFLRLLGTRFRYAPAEAPWWPRLPAWQTNRIEVEAPGATSFQVDGEDATFALAGERLLDVRVGPRLTVVAP
jgi:diacylglycerol kinase family enzyme